MNKFRGIKSLDYLINIKQAALGLFPSDSAFENLQIIYEWEYKYSRIKNSSKTNERRKEWLLATIQRETFPIFESVRNLLMDTFSSWLAIHDISSARAWAENRFTDSEERLDSKTYELNEAISEYARYAHTNIKTAHEEFIKCNIHTITPILDSYIQEEIDRIQEDIDRTDDEESKADYENYQSYLNSLESPEEKYHYVYELGMDMVDVVNNYMSYYGDDDLLSQMIITLYETRIFPLWYSHWAQEGLDGVRDNNIELLRSLEGLEQLPFEQRSVIINRALNGTHVTGAWYQI